MGKLSTRRGTIIGLHSFKLSVSIPHIFKDVLIIEMHLDLGGSDSETSRSTLAGSNSTTLDSVGDSSHASTSSSVRDLPYSSTSPASNQEQSSVEDSSASTDSGTYSQWFFKETWFNSYIVLVPFRPWW